MADEQKMSMAELAASLPPLGELEPRMAQMEQELDVLMRSYGELREAQERFALNVGTLAVLAGAPNKGAETLLPLTPMVYVAGRLCADAADRVLVDIGTGYYVQMNASSADAYYARRVRFLQEQLDALGRIIGDKRSSASAVAQAIAIQRSQAAVAQS